MDNNAGPKVARVFDCYTVFGAWPNRHARISTEELVGTLDKHRVTKAAAICAEAILGDSTAGNNQACAAAREHPKLLPVPALNPARFPQCMQELERLGPEGMRLFACFPETQEWSPQAISFRQLLYALHGMAAGLMVEATRAQTITELVRAAAETEIPLVLLGVNYHNLGEALAAARFYPQLYLDTHLLTAVGALERCVELVGGDRVLFGSGFPLGYFSSAFLRARFAAVSAEQLARVLHDNMAELVKGLACRS